MRLNKIRMSGFKSFVDPTTIHFPSDLVGIVGPNGCGKSNVIDATRWVMGESSRHLRGDSMDDVIFNGSTSRKPVSQASIELQFDNKDGKAGGRYAQYSEISIRRQLSRDGQSKYFLNNTRCRRRDIVDLFLGTGLGPRAYAIIEQGMITRLIESKPEELRVYLEEAAGISRYKERRRETENRISNTRENLDRLNDLREEVEKQINRLQRQARTAERYTTMKQEERRIRAELLTLRWQSLGVEAESRERDVGQQQNRIESTFAELRELEASVEKQRSEHNESNQKLNEVQGNYYKLGGDISRTEQAIQHGKDVRASQEEELKEVEQAWGAAEEHITEDKARLEQLATDIDGLEPEVSQANAALDEQAGNLAQVEEAMTTWQSQWESLGQRAAEPNQVAEVENTRIQHLERNIGQLQNRHKLLDEESSSLSPESLQVEIGGLETRLVEASAQESNQREELEKVQQSMDQHRRQNDVLGSELEEAQGHIQDLRGRLASLEALQEAALGKREKGVTEWLHGNRLGDAPRLAQQVKVDSGWELALETVLGQYLEAVCVDGVDAVVGVLGNLRQGNLLMLDTRTLQSRTTVPGETHNTLLEKVQSPWPLHSLLGGVFVAADLGAALAMRQTLAANESVVTRDGIWMSRNWLRVSRDSDQRAGVLSRENEIKTINENLQAGKRSAETLRDDLNRGREALTELEAKRENLQAEANRAHRIHAEAQARLSQHRSQFDQIRARSAQLTSEVSELKTSMHRDSEELERATRARNEALGDIENYANQRDALTEKKAVLDRAFDEARSKTQEQREQTHILALRLESLRSTRNSLHQSLERMESQLGHLRQRRVHLQQLLKASVTPIANQEQELKGLLQKRAEVEQQLATVRTAVQDLEASLREKDQQRSAIEERITELREVLDKLKMAWQEVTVRRDTLSEQIGESGFPQQTLVDEMQSEATAEVWESNLGSLQKRIDRLGPINLAAIDEYEEQKERKDYLDKQYADVTEALETLEQAIRKIDGETRNRFKDTFERVNVRMQEVFPRLFGGGEAHLEMLGDDLLTSGVSIMARPPGKRLSTIHLMSGGEKALTAVAVVFAFFELNPAPFCLLDEVDAPLDEANVGRFCELVREMSNRVQFVMITHNKSTMEFADQLIGVTMQEPGVSRLVAVDVEEAAKMAAG